MADEPMTVVFTMGEQSGPITIRTSAPHAAIAVEYAAEEACPLDEEDFAEAPEEMDFETRRWLDDDVKAIRVFAGWPAEDSDDVASLVLLHEEGPDLD